LRSTERADSVLRLLSGSDGFVSGTGLSASLGITRAALSKRVKSLRKKGFQIEASSGRGYRLRSAPGFSAEELRTSVSGGLGREAYFYTETISTNEVAMRLAGEGGAHGAVVAADSQTGGKGRLGRRWASPRGGNIYMSVILRPGIHPKDAPALALITAAAGATALRRLTGVKAMIKWPNDIVSGGKKLGGILLEMRSEPDRVLYAVAGVGINVNVPPGALPPDVRQHATSVLAETGREYPRTTLMAGVLDDISSGLESFIEEGPKPLIQRFRGLSSILGKRVNVRIAGESLTGTAMDIDREGRLMLETPGGVRRVTSGELRMLRPALDRPET
jgi:BirA family biotin operon repressor/biotin-[acetyl-CoA-carboxylase] ligase